MGCQGFVGTVRWTERLAKKAWCGLSTLFSGFCLLSHSPAPSLSHPLAVSPRWFSLLLLALAVPGSVIFRFFPCSLALPWARSFCVTFLVLVSCCVCLHPSPSPAFCQLRGCRLSFLPGKPAMRGFASASVCWAGSCPPPPPTAGWAAPGWHHGVISSTACLGQDRACTGWSSSQLLSQPRCFVPGARPRQASPRAHSRSQRN